MFCPDIQGMRVRATRGCEDETEGDNAMERGDQKLLVIGTDLSKKLCYLISNGTNEKSNVFLGKSQTTVQCFLQD